MNKLTWYNYDNTDADSFNVYRSVPGFAFSFSDLSPGVIFKFAATSPDMQQIAVNTSNIDAAVDSLNTGRGIEARKTTDGTSIIIRLTAQKGARLKLYSCSFLTDINIPPQIIVPGLTFSQVGSAAFVEGSEPYVFEDDDGSFLDSYYLTSVKDSVESVPSMIRGPLIDGINYCVVEARFIDIQGRPVRGVELTAEPATLDESGFSTNKVTVISDAYGRVALPLLQCQQYVLHAPAIGYNQYIEVPEINFLDLTKYPASSHPEFSPFGDIP